MKILLQKIGKARSHLANAVYGSADYLVQPILMLLAAPFLLHRLGAAQYGLWVLASAAVSSGNLFSSGFGDAAIKYISASRGCNDLDKATLIVRCMITINLLLSTGTAVLIWCIAPSLVRHIVHADIPLQRIGQQSLRIGCILLVVKSIESVFISTLRAFERYGPAFRIASFMRVLILLAAVLLVAKGYGVVSILYATLFLSIFGVVLQALSLRSNVADFALIPAWDTGTMRIIAGFGCFSWLQALIGVASTQADRLLIGFLLGAPALAYYSICTQAAQPIHGLISSGYHFLFPHLSARSSVAPVRDLRRTIITAFRANILLVVILAAPMIFFSRYILTLWMGPVFAANASGTLSIVAWSYALLGLNVTAYYSLLALGRVRFVSFLNLAATVAMLAAMALLIPHWGMQGAAAGRLIYGPITWITYAVLYKIVWGKYTASVRSIDSMPVLENI
jgi:O-antigen/teichoic acid export membrane protein